MHIKFKLYAIVLIVGILSPLGLAHAVNIVDPDDPQWCSYQNKCRYIGHFFYRSRHDQRKKRADKYVSKVTLKRGGDTFVYQRAEVIEDNDVFASDDDKRIVAFGHIYNCQQPPNADDSFYLKDRIQVYTQNNMKRCDGEKQTLKCKPVDRLNCSTSRDLPEYRCFRKFLKNIRGSQINRITFAEETYTSGRYRAYADMYRCDPIKSAQAAQPDAAITQ
jgi:hypothetical protein